MFFLALWYFIYLFKIFIFFITVKVFQQCSRGESIILVLPDVYKSERQDKQFIGNLAQKMINQIVYVDWPHLKEALVVGVSNGRYRVSTLPGTEDNCGRGAIGPVVDTENCPDNTGGRKGSEKARFESEMKNLQLNLLSRWGIDAKETSVMFYCKPLTGKRWVHLYY